MQNKSFCFLHVLFPTCIVSLIPSAKMAVFLVFAGVLIATLDALSGQEQEVESCLKNTHRYVVELSLRSAYLYIVALKISEKI